jgi:hypothetical protein
MHGLHPSSSFIGQQGTAVPVGLTESALCVIGASDAEWDPMEDGSDQAVNMIAG